MTSYHGVAMQLLGCLDGCECVILVWVICCRMFWVVARLLLCSYLDVLDGCQGVTMCFFKVV